ncbi:MAG TPA: M1 family metallopeptidase [Pseudomonadales bacterium]
MVTRRIPTLLLCALLGACNPAPEPETPPSEPQAAPPSVSQSTAAPTAPKAAGLEPPLLQLPASVTPLRYELDLTVMPERESFTGRARIDIRFDAATDGFWIHGRGLEVASARLLAGGERIDATYRQVTPDGVARVTLARPIQPQTAQLDISYRGRFSDLLEGLFRVPIGPDWYAFTQFEPLDARAAFPAFDEPRFKTPFELTIVAPKGQTVAANTPIAEVVSLPDGTRRVRFEPTLPLPTYLVAFAVGPLDVVDGGRVGVTAGHTAPLRGLAARGRGRQFAYALANTPALVALLEDYFALPYPFAKLDFVAVPTQQGAMENAGLITYSEYAMLFGDNPPLSQQRTFARLAAHELAHQWFGNSVTMKWWDDLWLNEAFATFMSFKIVERWRPSYRENEAAVQSLLRSMGADALVTARRIREPIESYHDVTNAFDGITYSKGAGVLGMLEDFVGESAFRDGIREYLRSHALASAEMSDLVASLARASGKDEIDGVLKTFTEQVGTPLIDVKVACGEGAATVSLSQQRFLPVGSKAASGQRWEVPVCVRYGTVDGTREHCTVLAQPTMDVALDAADGCPTWLMPNRGGRGYYRWRLDEPRLDRLTAVMYSALEGGERLSLADALAASVAAGNADLAAYFARLPQLLSGDDRYVMFTPMPLWRALQLHALDANGRTASRARMRELYGSALARLRQAGIESDEDRLTQAALIDLLAIDAHDPEIRQELTRGATEYLAGSGLVHRDKLDADEVNTALRVASQDGDPAFVVGLVRRLPDTEDAVLRYAMLSAIGSANDPTVAQGLALDGSIRGDDYLNLIGSMFSAERAERHWSWFAANVDALLEKAPLFERNELIEAMSAYCTAQRAESVAALFEPRLAKIDGGRRTLDQTLERIGLCVAFVDAYAPQARALFH